MVKIAVIVIGLNEEKNLKQCLSPLAGLILPSCTLEIIYVDSGSTDKSVEIAESFLNVRVVNLNDSNPSAAKARNLGVSVTDSEYIQFIDGDSVLDDLWLKKAFSILSSDDSIGAVFGAIEEVGEQNNIYMKVCRFDWYIPPGDYRLCGGNALWKRSAFDQAGLFDDELIAGEEPDLCFRVRQKGYRIVCIDSPMVKHDLDMHYFKDYWNRSVRSGTAYAIIAMRYRKTQEKLWFKEMIRNFAEVFIWLLLLTFGIFYSWKIATILLVFFLLYRIGKVVLNVLPRSRGGLDALIYALHIQFSRIPLVYGQILGLVEVFMKSISSKKNS